MYRFRTPLGRLALLILSGLFVSAPGAGAQPRPPAVPPAAGTAPGETTVSVTGTGRVERAPDYLDVSVGIESQEKTAAPAQAAADATMRAAIAAITKLGLAGQDLQTGTVELSPRYEGRQYNSEDPRKIIGYTATITLRVRTTDLTAAAKVIDAALGAGANRVDYVRFGIKEAIAAREEAIRLATQASKRKAKALADGLDLRLGRVVEATTTSQSNPWMSANRYSNLAQVANESRDAGAGAESDSPVVPGKIEVWADVSVTFAAGPA